MTRAVTTMHYVLGHTVLHTIIPIVHSKLLQMRLCPLPLMKHEIQCNISLNMHFALCSVG